MSRAGEAAALARPCGRVVPCTGYWGARGSLLLPPSKTAQRIQRGTPVGGAHLGAGVWISAAAVGRRRLRGPDAEAGAPSTHPVGRAASLPLIGACTKTPRRGACGRRSPAHPRGRDHPPPPHGSVAAATFFPSSLQKCVSKAAAAFEAAKAALTVGGTRPPPISERDTWGECSEGGAVGVVRAAHRTHGSPFLYAHTRDA